MKKLLYLMFYPLLWIAGLILSRFMKPQNPFAAAERHMSPQERAQKSMMDDAWDSI